MCDHMIRFVCNKPLFQECRKKLEQCVSFSVNGTYYIVCLCRLLKILEASWSNIVDSDPTATIGEQSDLWVHTVCHYT